MLKSTFTIVVYCLLLCPSLYSQDSLTCIQKLKDLPETDTTRFQVLDRITAICYYYPAHAARYSVMGRDLARKVGNKKREAFYQKKAGNFYLFSSNFLFALKEFTDAYENYKSFGDSTGMTFCLNGMGIMYGEKYRLTGTKEDLESSITYISQAMGNFKRLNDVGGIHVCMNNLSTKYILAEKYNRAISLLSENLIYYTDTNDINGISLSTVNLGDAYFKRGTKSWSQKDLDSARYFLEHVITKGKDRRPPRLHEAMFLLAQIELGAKRTNDAIPLLEKCIMYYELKKMLPDLSKAYQKLSDCYIQKGDKEKAYEYLSRYVRLKDSVTNQQNQNSLNNLQATFEMGRQEQEIGSLEKENKMRDLALENEKNKSDRQQLLIWSGVGSFVLVGIILLIIVRNNKKKVLVNSQLQRLNKSILNQNYLIQQKSEQIKESILYARSIQETILKGKKILDKNVKENFILFLPKDIVSGDFYWAREKQLPGEGAGGKLYIAAVDCTGHGIPGAFASLIAYRHLEYILDTTPFPRTDEILNKLNELLLQTYADGETSDLLKTGLDIALICIDMNTKKCTFSGAHLNLMVVTDGRMEVVEGNKLSVGHKLEERFRSKNVVLTSDSTIYLSTDGLKDQRSTVKGSKKIGKIEFEKMLLEISSKSLQEQGEKLKEKFMEYKGEGEQIDDVLVIGIKI